MRTKRLYSCNTSFLDLLFNMLLAFTSLFVLSFALINQDKEKSKMNAELKAEFILTMTWPDDMDNDIDILVEDPMGKIVFFRRREEGLMHLDRDDLGSKNDTVNTPHGSMRYPHNREIVTLRGYHSGEYCVNVFAYLKSDPRPCPVTVQLDKINPKLTTLLTNQIILDKNGEEKTIMRFKLNSAGEMTGSNTLQKILTNSKNP